MLAGEASERKTVSSLQSKGYDVIVLSKKEEVLGKIKELIPVGSSVMNGSSVTLEQIGYSDYLKNGKHGWIDLHARVGSETDSVKRRALRNEAVHADFYVGSVHALVEDGTYLNASNTGSQLPHIAFTSPNIIFVVGTHKIVQTTAEALHRIETYVLPLENDHMMKLYQTGSALNKILFSLADARFLKRRIIFILVRDVVGF